MKSHDCFRPWKNSFWPHLEQSTVDPMKKYFLRLRIQMIQCGVILDVIRNVVILEHKTICMSLKMRERRASGHRKLGKIGTEDYKFILH